jgi:F-type H+-transporting ATPase subunit epsilon
MLPDSIELVIVTPERQLLRESVTEAVLPGADGELGILPGHAPLITELGIGELRCRITGSKDEVHLAIIRGFAEVLQERVTVLAETAELAEEIDVERAKQALERARARIAASDANIDWDRASAALERALIRIKVGEFATKRRTAIVQAP